MADKKAQLEITLKDSVSRGLDQIKGGMDTLKTSIYSAAAAVTAITAGLVSSFKSFMENEDAVNKLNHALQNQGVYTKGASKDLQEYATQLQKTTTISDEAAMDTMSLLTTFGLYGDQLKAVTKTAADLSAGMGIDMRTAAMLLGKAFEGETGTLTRYGIVVDQTKSKTEKFNDVMAQLQKRFGGAAESELNTASGQIKAMENRIDDLKEAIGKELLPVFDFWIDKLNIVVGYLERMRGNDEKVLRGRELTAEALRKQIESERREIEALMLTETDASDKAIKFHQEKLKRLENAYVREISYIRSTSEERESAADKQKRRDLEEAARIEKFNKDMRDNAAKTASARAKTEASIRADIGKTDSYTAATYKARMEAIRTSYDKQASYSQLMTEQLHRNSQTMAQFMVGMTNQIQTAFSSGISSMILEGKSFGEAFKNIGDNLLRYFVEAVIQQMVAKWVAAMLMMNGLSAGAAAAQGASTAAGVTAGVSGATTASAGASGAGAAAGSGTAATAGAGVGGGITGYYGGQALASEAGVDNKGSEIGGAVGAGMGAVVGGIFGGPIGAFAGGAIGGVVGSLVGGAIGTLFGGESDIGATTVSGIRSQRESGTGGLRGTGFQYDAAYGAFLEFLGREPTQDELDRAAIHFQGDNGFDRGREDVQRYAMGGGYQLAAGGIVLPTRGGTVATIGEGGKPEAVIPLDDPRASGMLGGTHIHIHAGTIVADRVSVQEFAKRLDAELYKLQRRNTSVAFG